MIDDLHEDILKKGFITKEDLKAEPAKLLKTEIGKYRIIRLLGKGGLGDVYLAEDTQLSRPVALKVLARVGEQDLARFQREAVLTAKLAHPNIVKIYEIAQHDNTHYISMQYIDGQSLDKKDLTMRQKIDVVRQVALALDHAHSSGIIHRDVKPANILIDKDGRPYLTDFGIAKQISLSGARSSLSVSGMIIGTPSYMSPEQAAGEIDKVDYLSDVYSLGATLYFLLTQREPYHADSAVEIINKILEGDLIDPRKLNKKIPMELEAIILKAMEKDRQKRYQSTFDLAKDLRFYLEGKPTIARPRSAISRVLKRLKSKKTALGIIVTCLIMILTAGALAYFKIKASQRKTYELSEKINWCGKKLGEFDSLFYMPLFNITTKYDLLDEVIKASDELLKSDDREAVAHGYFYKGEALFRKGRLEEAYQNLDKAINLSDQPIFYLTRAKVALEIYRDKLDIVTCFGGLQAVVEKYKSWKESAEKDIKKYLENKPAEKDWLTIYARAMILYCEMKAEAKDLLKQLVGKTTPEQSADILKLYAEACQDLTDFDEAIESFKKAINIKRSDYNLYIGLGTAYLVMASMLMATGRDETCIDLFNKAIDEYSKALSINPLSDFAYFRRAMTRYSLLEFTQAGLEEGIEDCTKAISINPESALALSQRAAFYSIKARLLTEQGERPDELVKLLDKDLEAVLKITTDDEHVLENCAYSFLNRASISYARQQDPTSDFDRAIELFKKALKGHEGCDRIGGGPLRKCLLIINNMAITLNEKALYLVTQEKNPSIEIEDAIEALTKAIKINSNFINSYLNIAQSHLVMAQYLVDQAIDPKNELEKGLLYLKKGLEINPEYDELYIFLGRLYWLKLRYSSKLREKDEQSARSAIENYSKAIDLINSQPAVSSTGKLAYLYEYRGGCYHTIADKKSAISDWQKAMELQPHLKDKYLLLIRRAEQMK